MTSTTTGRSRAEGGSAWRPIFGSLWTRSAALGTLAMLFVAGGPMWLTFFLLMANTAALEARSALRWMQPLPFSRRYFALFTVAPVLMVVAASGIGAFTTGPLLREETMTMDAPRTTERKNFRIETQVPLTFWMQAGKDPVPAIVSPWGEAGRAETLQLLGQIWYNPYSTEKSASDRFRDWQFERATAAVYGTAIAFSRYGVDQKPPARVTRSPRVLILTAACVLTLALLIVNLGEVPRWHIFGRSPRIKLMMQFIPAVPMLLIVADVLYQFSVGVSVISAFGSRVLLDLSRSLPAGPLALAMVATLPVLATFLLLQWQCGRSDFTERPLIPQK